MSMKLIKLQVEGVKNFKNNILEIDFTPDQRVTEDEIDSDILELSKNIQTNSVFAITGINASGKTTTLKIIQLVVDILCRSKDISSLNKKQIVFMNSIFQDEIEFKAFWASTSKENPDENRIYFSKSTLEKDPFSVFSSEEPQFYFSNETLSYIATSKINTKKNLFNIVENYSDFKIDRTLLNKALNQREEKIEMMDFSIPPTQTMMAFLTPFKSSFNSLFIESINPHEDFSFLQNINFEENIEIIKLFDPSVEHIIEKLSNKQKSKRSYQLKFYGQDPISLSDGKEFVNYLSAGTLQGIEILCGVRSIIDSGGILLIDEIENHLNKSIIKVIIKIFLNNNSNKQNSQLIFTTHYGELLDLINRRDSIFIITRENNEMNIKKSSEFKQLRKEIKNSSLFFGGHFGTGIEHQRLTQITNFFKKDYKGY